ncbi:serine/threonine-protein kinase [Gloeocapsa sp. PCC 73106]|uniref:serine/threonine protein kinase n=1 Tax=Gloeocapsa sp. PCC 73106 TaxID=102232 RepID=UPI0002AC72FA|nr:serine/threonine-protein kinase [Gloeocapsa sp. PCC 73106]ELR96238.1 serine/threonine protein kinase [Gloeocapsa sp. PCC 73106]
MFQSQQILENRYKMERQLGRTALGHQTWLATDLSDLNLVAIKLLAFNPQMRWEELKLFEREAQVLQQLSHPRIPRYRDYFDLNTEGLTWFALVQDYIPGFSFQELLEQHRCFEAAEILKLATQILEILQYLHQFLPPVLHRDLKPSNLIEGEDGRVYLIDFGAVQAQPGTTGTTFTVVGSSGYTPLEQFWGKAVPASDLYALGTTLIHLLTGIPPASLPQEHSRIQFADRVALRPDLLQWLTKMTEPDLEKRFSSATAALNALGTPSFDYNQRAKGNCDLKRPVYTRIKLTQTPDKLTIFLPSGGYRKLGKIIDPDFWLAEKTIFGRIFGDLTNTSPLSMVIILLSLAVMAFTIGLLQVFLIVITVKLLILYCESIDIYLDSQQLELVRQSLGFIYGGKRINLKEVQVVKHKKREYIHEVVLETEAGRLLIGHALREDECRWLIQAINNWLAAREE